MHPLLGLLLLTAAQDPDVVTIQVGKDKLDFLVGKTVATSYHIKQDLPRPFLWPLKAPNGTETTRAWPMGPALDIEGKKPDHPHHRSAWFCYGDVIPEGMELKSKIKGVEGVDFWSEAKGHGNIVCVKVEEPVAKGNSAWVVTRNEWRTAEGDKVMDETRKITFQSHGKAYLIVLDIDLHASVCPITFGDTKEGAMAIRAHPEIAVKSGKGKMTDADGRVNEKPIWGHKSAWCDYSGPVGGKVVGVALLDDPKNPYPVCWHARDYGLMAGNPFGRQAAKFEDVKDTDKRVRLAKGEHLHLRYGIVVHDGDAEEAMMTGRWRHFVKLRAMEK
jgi:hypothetical protein